MFIDNIEQVTISTVGGPSPGKRVVPITTVGGIWPLPEYLEHKGEGHYKKIRESDLTEAQANQFVRMPIAIKTTS